MSKLRAIVAAACVTVVTGLCASAASASPCPNTGLTPAQALHEAISWIVGWEKGQNLAPTTIRQSRQAMETEKPKRLECSGNACLITWRAWPVSVWCSDGRLSVGLGGAHGSPWATIPFGIIAWNSLPG
jgi:hypothetical protein